MPEPPRNPAPGKGGIFGPGLHPRDTSAGAPEPPSTAPRTDAPLAPQPRDRVAGEVVGEREAIEADARRRAVARTPSIALAAPGFLLLLFALGRSGRGVGATAGSPLMKVGLTGALCLGAALCFGVLAAKAESQPGKIAWTAGIMGATIIFLQAVVANV